MEIKISSWDREEAHILAAYESLVWEPMYNEMGTFSLVIDRQYYKYFSDDCIIEVGTDNMYQGLFEYLTDLDSIDSQTVTIQGHFLTKILDRRGVTDIINYENVTLESFINSMMSKTFLSSDPARRMNFVVDYSPASLKNERVTVSSEPDVLLNIFLMVFQENDIGFNVFLDDNLTYHLQIYRGEDKTLEHGLNPVMLSKDWDSALQIVYTKSTENIKNFAYVVAGDDENRLVYTIDQSNATGLQRREIVFGSNVSRDEEMSTTEYKNLVLSETRKSLLDYKAVELLECELSDKYDYGTDIRIGDTVTIDSLALGLSVTARILSAEEIWDRTGYSVSVSIGSSASLIRYIRK